MGHVEPLHASAGRIAASRVRRPLDVEAVAAEDEQVEVELAGSPSIAGPPAEGRLETLERQEQGDCTRRGIRATRDIQGDHGIQEVRLVENAHRARGVEPGDTAEMGLGERAQRADRSLEGPPGVADVGAQPDVRSHPPTTAHGIGLP